MKTNVRFFRPLTPLVLHLLAIGCIASAQSPVRNNIQYSAHTEVQTGDTTFIILANRRTQPRLWPILEADLRRDAAAVSPTAPVTARVHLVLAGAGTPGPSFPSRLEVELLGRCDTPWNNDPGTNNFGNAGRLSHSDVLGWVLKDSGKIAPVIYVDCAQINEVLGSQTRIIPANLRLRIAGEAISHVILHEWIHIATQSAAHSTRGIMEAALTAAQLTTPIAGTGNTHSQSQKKSEPESGSEGELPMTGFTLLIGDQR